MLIETDSAVIATFCARKLSQFDRIAGALPGLQLVRSGERGTAFMLVYSTGDLYEGVVFGQMPHRVTKLSGSPRNPVRRDAPNDAKPFDMRSIDWTDADLDAVIAAWQAGRSALTLEFVPRVYRRDGRPQVA